MKSRLLKLFFLACVVLSSFAAQAQGRLLADEELAEVSGRGLMEPSNYSYQGLDFTRIVLGADIQLNANLAGIELGKYVRNGVAGTDIDIPLLRIGRSDAGDAQRIVRITDPYLEFAYATDAVSGQRDLVGMRLGFKGIQGSFGVGINSVSGSLRIDAGAAGVIDSANSASGGVRWNGSCPTCTTLLSQLGSVTAGDANGPSRDLWMSIAKTPIQFAPIPGAIEPQQVQAAMGFWLNWRDRLSGSVGAAPPNLPRPGG